MDYDDLTDVDHGADGAAGGALVTGDHAVDCCGGTGFFYWLVCTNSTSYVVN